MGYLSIALGLLTLLSVGYVNFLRPRWRPPFRAANGGGALPDGSYPVRTHGDAERALLLVMEGHGNAAAAKQMIRHIAEENRWRDILKRLDAMPVAEHREPRDTSRPYPRPAGVGENDDRLLTCPLCGMEDPLFLDGGPDQGDLMGWPAHETCVEWLGDWKPPVSARPMPKYSYVGGSAPVYLGGTAATVLTPLTREWAVNRTAEAVHAQTEALNAGLITLDELRERIVGAFGIPEMTITATSADAGTVTCDCGMSFSGSVPDLDRSMEVHRTSGQHEQRMAYQQRMGKALDAPVSHMWCTCGKEFTGTPAGIKSVMDAHHHSGECPHSAANRQRHPEQGTE